MSKEKCYPVKNTNVTICPHNKNGYCESFNKKCDNVQSLEPWIKKAVDEMIAITPETPEE